VLNGVIAERRYTAMDGRWSVEAEASYIAGLGPRSILNVAEAGGKIVGFQTLEPFATYTPSMDHVGTLGTIVSASWRGRGAGRQLWEATRANARSLGYQKVVILVRASNQGALSFYRALGFEPRGSLRRQVRIDGAYDDEVFMELFLREQGA
jgi:RimJ/RimL family protein N-acetyltransferase